MTRAARAFATLIAVLLAGTTWWSFVARTQAKTRLEGSEVMRRAAEVLAQERAARIAVLESELSGAIAQRDSVARAAERVADLAKGHQIAAASRKRATTRVIPEGVRVALQTFNELLAASGQAGLRFLHATTITKDRLLLGAELIDADPKSLRTTLYLPETLEARLDRQRLTLTLVMRGGVRVAQDTREPLPATGFVFVVEGVDGPAFEQRLPMLVFAEGAYPVDAAAQSRPSRLPTATTEAWRERLNELLARATGEEHWRCERFQDLESGYFRRGLLVATKGGRTVKRSIEAERFAISIDQGAGTVSLIFEGGVLHAGDGDTSIPATGFAILLAGLEPKTARDALFGLVVGE